MQTFQCRRYIFKIFNFFPKNMKKTLLMIAPNFFFSIANRSKTSQPKSHFLFHKNVFLRDFYIKTLVIKLRNFLQIHNCIIFKNDDQVLILRLYYLISTIIPWYHQDLWGIYASENSFFAIFITHSLTNSMIVMIQSNSNTNNY